MAVTSSILNYCSYGVSPEEVVIKKSTTTTRRRHMMIKSISMMSIEEAGNHPKSITSLPRTKSKVFEDQSKGIVCYREENGEITCEGIDEGPRFHLNSSTTATTSQTTRDAEMVDLLQRCWPHHIAADKANFN